MSAFDDQQQLIQAATLGAHSYLIKTLYFDDLIDIVAKIILQQQRRSS